MYLTTIDLVFFSHNLMTLQKLPSLERNRTFNRSVDRKPKVIKIHISLANYLFYKKICCMWLAAWMYDIGITRDLFAVYSLIWGNAGSSARYKFLLRTRLKYRVSYSRTKRERLIAISIKRWGLRKSTSLKFKSLW